MNSSTIETIKIKYTTSGNEEIKMLSSNHLMQLFSFIGILNLLLVHLSESAPVVTTNQVEASKLETLPKLKRDSRAKMTALELLDSQETGYLPSAYQATDSDYGYDSGKNTYGKQAADWSLYDQGMLSV